MRPILNIVLLFFSTSLFAQKTEEFGFRHLKMMYKGETVDILIKSKKGEEWVPKPLFLFCQGSLPIPLIIKYNDNGVSGIFNVFVFNTDSLSNKYHLAIIGKPFIPLIAEQRSLAADLTYADSLGAFPIEYSKRNLLSYYVGRDIEVIKFLQKQKFISASKLIVAGHSEGSAVAAGIASTFKKVTHLIYSGGSPLGRMMSIAERERSEQLRDSSIQLDKTFTYWNTTVLNKNDVTATGDTYKGLYEFSIPPPLHNLLKLNIPILVTYGTKDYGAVAQNDYLRIAATAKQKANFTFIDYVGTDHNFFPLLQNGKPNFDVFNWDKVAGDWYTWLMKN